MSSLPLDLAHLAAMAGALALGEDGPDGAHYIFSVEQLARFVVLICATKKELPPLPY